MASKLIIVIVAFVIAVCLLFALVLTGKNTDEKTKNISYEEISSKSSEMPSLMQKKSSEEKIYTTSETVPTEIKFPKQNLKLIKNEVKGFEDFLKDVEKYDLKKR